MFMIVTLIMRWFKKDGLREASFSVDCIISMNEL